MSTTTQLAPPSQPWFLGAPLSRLIGILTILSYAIIESRNSHKKMAFDTTAIVYNGELYRLITGPLSFHSSGELVFGLLLMINFSRRFEREMGTRKYCVWLTAVAIISIMFQITASQFDFEIKYNGPYPTIGALIWNFHVYAARLHPRFFGLAGIHFSEKTMGYAFAAQVMLYLGYNSLIPSLSGMVASFLLSHSPVKLDVPDALAVPVSNTMNRFIDDPPTPLVPRQQLLQQHNLPRRNRAPPPAPPAFEQPPPPPPPDESVVEQLTSMGFERDQVLTALRTSDNNVERAADRLLAGMR